MNDAESNRQKEILRVLEDFVGDESTTTSDETSLEEIDDTEGTCTCGASSHADQVL